MIRQKFKINKYWKVVVYYDLDYNLLNIIEQELLGIDMSESEVNEIINDLQSGKVKAITCNNIKKLISVVIFTPHKSKKDFINSIVHEAEHIKQAILEAYNVEDIGEAPAYTIGYIISQMYKAFIKYICLNYKDINY